LGGGRKKRENKITKSEKGKKKTHIRAYLRAKAAEDEENTTTCELVRENRKAAKGQRQPSFFEAKK